MNKFERAAMERCRDVLFPDGMSVDWGNISEECVKDLATLARIVHRKQPHESREPSSRGTRIGGTTRIGE
jgi:hypothetical protein